MDAEETAMDAAFISERLQQSKARSFSEAALRTFWQQYKLMPGNNACFDCGAKDPKWADPHHGVTLCLQCVGSHRQYFPRSLTLDLWREEQLSFMALGGNENFTLFIKSQKSSRPNNVYDSKIGESYRAVLAKRVRDASDKVSKHNSSSWTQVW